jgi:hypothetical protein
VLDGICETLRCELPFIARPIPDLAKEWVVWRDDRLMEYSRSSAGVVELDEITAVPPAGRVQRVFDGIEIVRRALSPSHCKLSYHADLARIYTL